MLQRATTFLRAFRTKLPAKREPPIKVGDQVEIVATHSSWDHYVGKVVAIERVRYGKSVYWVAIPILTRKQFPQMFREHELARVGTL